MQGSFVGKKYDTVKGPSVPREIVLHPQHINDLMLWTAFRSGDEKAFITIFDRFAQPLFNYGCKIISEQDQVKDGIQELFIEIWQNKSQLGDTDSIKFYLFKSLRRKLLRVKAKKSNNPFLTVSLDQESNHGVSPSHERILIGEQMSAEKKEKVMLMISQLSKRQQEVLFLRYFEELNCDQIAVVMHISKQAVYNLIHHALEGLRNRNFSVRHFEE